MSLEGGMHRCTADGSWCCHGLQDCSQRVLNVCKGCAKACLLAARPACRCTGLTVGLGDACIKLHHTLCCMSHLLEQLADSSLLTAQAAMVTMPQMPRGMSRAFYLSSLLCGLALSCMPAARLRGACQGSAVKVLPDLLCLSWSSFRLLPLPLAGGGFLSRPAGLK